MVVRVGRRRGAVVAVLAAGVVVVALAASADAHALVRRSDPSDGALLQTAPSRVVITFTEPPDLGLSSIRVLNQAGAEVQSGSARPVPGQPLELRVGLRSLDRGVYTVVWRTVSKADGHVTAGSLSFGVGVSPLGAAAPPGGAAPVTPSPTLPAVAGRWALYWGLALLLGGAAGALLAFGTLPRGGRWLLAAAWLLSVGGLMALAWAERSSVGVPWSRLLRSEAGRSILSRGIALSVVGAATVVAAIRPRRPALGAVALAAAGAMLAHALGGHAGAGGGAASRWFDVTVQWGHLVAVGIWVGGLPWLLLALADGRVDPGRAVRRFSAMAGVALAVVAGTGLLRAVSELGWRHPLHGIIDTSFGLALLVKVALFVALVALGARNRYANVPKVDAGRTSPLRRTVIVEVVVAAVILGATGVLSELPPAATLAASAARPVSTAMPVVVSGSDFGTTVRVLLTVTPGTVGPNRFEARLTDYDTGSAVEASRVQIRFALPGRPQVGSPTLELTRTSAGTWTGQGTVLSLDGTWDAAVVIQQASGGVEVPLRLSTRLPPEEIQVSRAPGQPDLYTISLSEDGSLQTYVDPGEHAGSNTVHFTFFQASGDEQPIASAIATALTPSGVIEPLDLIRFDAGHFVANVDLSAGRWRFQIQADTRDGATVSGYFVHDISP